MQTLIVSLPASQMVQIAIVIWLFTVGLGLIKYFTHWV